MDAFIWLDIETTGLDPVHDTILEIAMVVTNFDLQTLGARSMLVDGLGDGTLPLHIDPIVVDMHEASGLWDSLNEANKRGDLNKITYVEEEFGHWLDDIKHNHTIETFYLAGSSVHFDRSFINVWAPSILDRVSHRHLDVSTLKLFNRMIEFDLEVHEVGPKHRALSDCMASLDYCKATFKHFAHWIKEDNAN